MTALTAEDLAREFGRSTDWVYKSWKQLVALRRIPPPLIPGELIWSAAQVYAYLDQDLPEELQARAAAYRAAVAAAQDPPDTARDASLAQSRARLNQRWSRP